MSTPHVSTAPHVSTVADPIASIDPRAIGEQLMRARKAAGLTQAQAAAELDVARTTMTAIESGARRPRPAEFVRLAQLYRRSVGDLVRAATQPRSIGFEVFFRTAGGAVDPQTDPALAADIQRFEQCGGSSTSGLVRPESQEGSVPP